jgi:nucleotide-binding universal stress UspA family protein
VVASPLRTSFYTTMANTTAAVTVTNSTWFSWTSSGTSSAITDGAWAAWVAVVGSGTATTTPTTITAVAPPTPEQIAAARERAVAADRRSDEARARAKALLRTVLPEELADRYEKDGYFDLTVHRPDGTSRVYRVHRTHSMNVHRLTREGKVHTRYCLVPSTSVPLDDAVAAQYLALCDDEEAFIERANRDWTREGRAEDERLRAEAEAEARAANVFGAVTGKAETPVGDPGAPTVREVARARGRDSPAGGEVLRSA